MEEAAVQPDGVPGGFHERFPKMFALVDVLNQSVAVGVALGVSAHRRVQVEEGHLVLRDEHRLAVDNERVDLGRPRPLHCSVTDRSGLRVGHAPRLDEGGGIRPAGLAGDEVQEALLDINVVVTLFDVGTGRRWWCSRARRDAAVQHQDDGRLLHKSHHVRLVRNAPKASGPEPQRDRERKLDAVPGYTV